MRDAQTKRFGQPVGDSLADHDPIDHRFDAMVLARAQLGRIVDVDHFAIDASPEESGLADRGKHLLMLPFPAAHQRGQDHHLRARRQCRHFFQYLLGRLLLNRRAALVALGRAQPGHQQPQMVVDFRDRGDGAARILAAGPLVDRHRRLQALDQIDVGPLQLMQKLPGVDRQAFDILPLAFGIQRVERQRAFARTAGAGDDDQPIAGNVEIDVLQIMDPRAANPNRLERHGSRGVGVGKSGSRNRGCLTPC